jgi:hypothetical protein
MECVTQIEAVSEEGSCNVRVVRTQSSDRIPHAKEIGCDVIQGISAHVSVRTPATVAFPMSTNLVASLSES